MSPETIKKLQKSKEGGELVKYLLSHIKSQDQVSDIPDEWDNQRRGEEVAVRKRVGLKLSEILEPLINTPEPIEAADEPESDIYYDHLGKK